MPAPIGSDPSRFENLRHQQSTGAAHQRGDTGRAGRAATQSGPRAASGEETREPQVEREIVPSGLARESFPDGETRLHMPTGHVVIHRPGEEPWVSGPDGEQLPAQHDRENGIYGFVDAQGNQVLLQPGEMAFAVRNASGTVSQQVHASGAQLIEAEVTFQQRGTGRTEQVVQRVVIDPEGNIHQENQLPGGSRVAPDGLEFGTKGLRLDLPYRIPQDLQGPQAAPPRAGAAPAPPPPPPPVDVPPAAPDVLYQPSPEMPPQAPPGMGAMPPGGMPPGMGPQAAPSSDPFAPVNAPSGLIRQRTPEGQLHISLPNGIVLSMAPDGTAQAFDARANGPVPAMVRPRPRPDGAVELQYDFPDAQGNRYTMFSDSLDFAVTSADGRTRQVVLPQGNILVGVRGAEGKSHRMEILPNGGVNTFGEGGVQMAADRVLFGASQPPEMVPLPYPMPPFQGMIAAMRPLQPGAMPVSGLVPPEFAAAGGYAGPGPAGMPQQPGFPGAPPAFPPGYGMPSMTGMPPGMGMGMPPGYGQGGMPPGYGPGGMPPGYGPGGMPPGHGPSQQGPTPGAPPPEVAPPAPGTRPYSPEEPASVTPRPGQPQETVEPGLWQRVKNFFKGDDDGPRHRPQCGPYPGAAYRQPFNPYTGLAIASVGVTALTTAMLASSMMMYPMGFCYSPMMMGMGGMGMGMGMGGFGGWCY